MIEQYLTAYGYWKNTKETFERLCKIDSRANPNHKDHQKFLKDIDSKENDPVFYYLEPDEKIVGDWGDVVIYKYTIEGVTNDIRY